MSPGYPACCLCPPKPPLPDAATYALYDQDGELLWWKLTENAVRHVDIGGDYVVALTSGAAHDEDHVWLHNLKGELVWVKDSDASSVNRTPRTATIDSDGNVYLATDRAFGVAPRLYKVDADGDTVFDVEADPYYGYAHVSYRDGILYGTSRNDSNVGLVVHRINPSNGSAVWSTEISSLGISSPARCRASRIAGRVVVARQIVVVLDSSGNVLWDQTRSLPSLIDESGCSIDRDNYVAVGGGRHDDITHVRYDEDGVEEWNADHGASVLGVDTDDSGNVYIAAYNSEGNPNSSTTRTIRKYSSSGVLQWSEVLGKTHLGHGYGVDLSDIAVGHDKVVGEETVPGKVIVGGSHAQMKTPYD